MAPKPKNPRKRGLLRTILGKPYNSKIFPNRPTPSGGEVVKKFSPTPHSRNVNRVVPDLQGKTAPIDDGSYSVASGGKGKFKTIAYYNKDGKRIRKPKN